MKPPEAAPEINKPQSFTTEIDGNSGNTPRRNRELLLSSRLEGGNEQATIVIMCYPCSDMQVSPNGGTPKSSSLIGFSIYKPSILATPILRHPQMWLRRNFVDGLGLNLREESLGLGMRPRGQRKQ